MDSQASLRPANPPAFANEEGDGVVIGDGPVVLDAYVDFQCPYCRMFAEMSGPVVDALISSGRITAVYHPVAILDAMSTNRYSTRAAAASGCAADGGRFMEYHYALFANQPPEGGPGLTDDELIALGEPVGLTDSFAACVRDGAHLDWPPYVTARAYERGVRGTPTILVAGAVVQPYPGPITTAVTTALSQAV
ncbi:thioredoxin domain-containing protein [Streptomyces sp. TP-A0356]|uniref:DsbA family protein n=1 Tax=Streptomyces sp. TP-A0356 TaxID=1359208 RepID=UPI0006E3C3A7|nr:thioredoxin domain-containing protein [Streptomyces sp. TP-A0356]